MFVIARKMEGRKGKEYAIDNNAEVLEFPDKASAYSHLLTNGYSKSKLKKLGISVDPLQEP